MAGGTMRAGEGVIGQMPSNLQGAMPSGQSTQGGLQYPGAGGWFSGAPTPPTYLSGYQQPQARPQQQGGGTFGMANPNPTYGPAYSGQPQSMWNQGPSQQPSFSPRWPGSGLMSGAAGGPPTGNYGNQQMQQWQQNAPGFMNNYGQQGQYNTMARDMAMGSMGNYQFGGGNPFSYQGAFNPNIAPPTPPAPTPAGYAGLPTGNTNTPNTLPDGTIIPPEWQIPTAPGRELNNTNLYYPDDPKWGALDYFGIDYRDQIPNQGAPAGLSGPRAQDMTNWVNNQDPARSWMNGQIDPATGQPIPQPGVNDAGYWDGNLGGFRGL